MNKLLEKTEESLTLDSNYREFLTNIKARLKTAQIRAALAANVELVRFYWQLGSDLIKQQKKFEWGENFLEQFSSDLRKTFPTMQGFSVTNLKRMRLFAKAYPKSPQLVDQLPWGHISHLIHAVKDESIRGWYVQQTIKNGWSRSVLEMQIESGLYERQGVISNKVTNYHEHLPSAQSDLARDILKDPYNFDFLTITDEAHERDIENALVTHVRDFLIELGQGFAFVGSQVPLTIDDQEFFIDLLFYHLHLRCFVVVELKANGFKPEHTGQLGFYLAVVDDLMKKESDNPTIGILLCKSKNKIVAEYALRGMKAPIGISEYTLSKELSKDFKSSLPTIKEIEDELSKSCSHINMRDGVKLNYETISLADFDEKIKIAREDLEDRDADWATLQIIYPYAYDLNEALTKEMDLMVAQEKIRTNLLVLWLNNPPHNFFQVKKKLIAKKLIPSSVCHIQTIDNFRAHYRLEYICSAIIRFLMDSKEKLDQVPALKSEHEKIIISMSYIKKTLEELGTLYFQNEILQYLMQYCIEELLIEAKRNVFSTGKRHKDLARELMVKRFAELFYFIFRDHQISDEFICEISITIAAHFFSKPMELKEVRAMIAEIKESAEKKNVQRTKTIEDLLTEYALKKSVVH